MKTQTAKAMTAERFLLGEGPCWNAETKELSWVDIKTGTLHRRDAEGKHSSLQTGQYLGAAIPTRTGKFICLMATGIYLAKDTELLRKLDTPDRLEIWQRFNDAKCDPRGRLLAGTMPLFMQHLSEGGSLYFYSGGHARRYDMNVTVPNGMAWTADGRTLYLVETAAGRIDRFAYDPETGEIGEGETVIRVDGGMPDGMTIDAKGKLWVAVWGGGEVRRYDPLTGECMETVTVGAVQVSSCCFGGEDLKTLYITTSSEGDPNPEAGCLFCCRPGVAGTKTVLFDDGDI